MVYVCISSGRKWAHLCSLPFRVEIGLSSSRSAPSASPLVLYSRVLSRPCHHCKKFYLGEASAIDFSACGGYVSLLFWSSSASNRLEADTWDDPTHNKPSGSTASSAGPPFTILCVSFTTGGAAHRLQLYVGLQIRRQGAQPSVSFPTSRRCLRLFSTAGFNSSSVVQKQFCDDSQGCVLSKNGPTALLLLFVVVEVVAAASEKGL